LVLREEDSDGGVWFCDMSRRRRECIERGETVGSHINALNLDALEHHNKIMKLKF